MMEEDDRMDEDDDGWGDIWKTNGYIHKIIVRLHMNNRAVEHIHIQKLEHDSRYVVLVTVCWVMTYIVTKNM